jgi:hypothetical protein
MSASVWPAIRAAFSDVTSLDGHPIDRTDIFTGRV